MAETIQNGELVIGEYVLKFDRNEIIADEYREIAERELRETPEVRSEAVARLREMLTEVEGLNFPLDADHGDEILIRFLRPCKFYPESALKMMKHYFAFKFNSPNVYGDLLCKADRNVFDQDILTIIPKRDQHGRMFISLQVGTKWIPKKCSLVEIIRCMMIAIEGSLLSPTNQITGGVVIFDCEGMTLTHVFQFTPSLAMALLHYIQDCLPFRLKALHIVNQPSVFKMIFAIFKPFLTAKLRSRIHFHGRDRDSLLQHIDASCLPVCYGGDLELPYLPGSTLFDYFSYYKQTYDEIAALGYTQKPKC